MTSHSPTEFIFAMTTCPSLAQAELLTSEILEAKLAACVTTIPGGVSTYWWQDKIEKSEEVVLLIKTLASNSSRLQELFGIHHPYEVPEFIAFPVVDGSPDYLSWLRTSCK